VLPSIIDEVNNHNARLLVIDNSISNVEKREYLLALRQSKEFFLMISDNTSYAHSRNLGLHLGQELYAPDIITILDDDHGIKPGFIPATSNAVNEYYGQPSPNGLRYGMFTCCHVHTNAELEKIDDSLYYPKIVENQSPFVIGGANGCCRIAPASHWASVLKRYDTDSYSISNFQSSGPRWRNYYKGFTAMFIGKPGQYIFDIEEEGRGEASPDEKLWDSQYAKDDPRSKYLGKE
jgi:hypothetical protein